MLTIDSIKKLLKDHVGDRLKIIAQSGRKRRIEHFGVLKEVYPAVFIVDLDEESNSFERISYSYRDVLTKDIELIFSE